MTNPRPWMTPELLKELEEVRQVNPELAQAMEEMGLPAEATGQILAGEEQFGDDSEEPVDTVPLLPPRAF